MSHFETVSKSSNNRSFSIEEMMFISTEELEHRMWILVNFYNQNNSSYSENAECGKIIRELKKRGYNIEPICKPLEYY